MGNCIERCRNCSNRPEEKARPDHHEQERPPRDDEDNRKLGGMRVKIVLTKEELQMLMAELKNRQEEEEEQGKKRSLEDVLDEIERVRRRSANANVVSSSSWKPSLESIAETESSEVISN